MELSFFGGASGIGASCVLVRTRSLRVVVDCGIRQGRGESLPDLDGLQAALDGAAPDAIVLTHAHLDHSGALPLLNRTWPQVPILCTAPTADLVRILLLDAVKVMDLDRDQEVPLYGERQVEATLAALKPCPPDDPISVGDLAGGEGEIRLLPAGHILGAACAFVREGRRSVLVTGDISITSQSAISGMPRPRVRPEAVVVESTYGNRMHSSRNREEQRLCEQVAAGIERGGHVLVPAFAVGRSQEVLLSLAAAMRAGRIPSFPVYADGMVRAVCAAYARHPAFLSSGLRRRVHRERDPFFPEDLSFERITGREHRDRVISGPPCCVVASSGMLAGGASPVYARAWMNEPESLVCITGYQDEESPGRALLALADGDRKVLPLPSGPVEVRCAVERYHLSAHADADQITGLLTGLGPRSVWLVHGDDDARCGLEARVAESLRTRTERPVEGRSYAVAGRGRAQPRRWQGRGIGGGRPLDERGLRQVADLLMAGRSGTRRVVRAEEIAQAWHGESFAPEHVHEVRRLLLRGSAAFRPDPRYPHRFHPVPAEPTAGGPASQARVLATIDQSLPASTGLVKRSLYPEEHRVLLAFALPDSQAEAARPVIRRLEVETGWRFEIHPHPRQDALRQAVLDVLPPGTRIVKGPAYVQDRRLVHATVHPVPSDPAPLHRQFTERTGWRLSLDGSASSPWEAPAAGTPPQRVANGAPLEPQEARRHVLATFAELPPALRPIKVGYPADRIRLHLPHPGMLKRLRPQVEALAEATGREVYAHPHPVHQRLLPLVEERIPEHWALSSSPSWVQQHACARINVITLPPQEEIDAFAKRIEEELGCPVVVEVN